MTQRYDTYKDSGVQWLGEILGHWGAKLKLFCKDNKEQRLISDVLTGQIKVC